MTVLMISIVTMIIKVIMVTIIIVASRGFD